MPKPLTVFLGVASSLLAIAEAAETVYRYLLHAGPPYNSPLLQEHHPDLLMSLPRFQHLHTIQFFTDSKDAPYLYPAPDAVFYKLFFLAAPHELAVFFTFTLLCFLVAALFLGRSLVRSGLGPRSTYLLLSFALLTSFPLWFEIRQGNLEICSWVFIALGIWSLARDRSYTAAAFIGIAGALKITPFFYLGVFLAKRQYRQILVAIVCAAAITVPSLWLLYPHIAESWRLNNLAIASFRTLITLRTYYPPEIAAFDHSLFGLVKRLVIQHITAQHLSVLLTIYSATAAVSMLVLFFGWIRKLPFTNQIICLCVATLIVPPTSFDYTLMSLYLPWALLTLLAVQEQRQRKASPGIVPAMVCFAILFVPETEIIVNTQSIAGQIKAVTLVALLVIALRHPFPQPSPTQELDA